MTKQSVHFSGIGGTGMVAGARLAVEAGWEVRGSDNPLYPPTSDMVAELGVPVAYNYAAENLDWNPDILVVGNVLSRGNPEVEAALSRRMHMMSLPEWLKIHVLRKRRPIVIAGTHGKTTTTALTAHVLDHCGFYPGYLIGGQPIGIKNSARYGAEGAPFVIEGDEYDSAFFDKRAKFLHYLPEIAVVTSVEFDHGDIYRDLLEIEIAFERLLRQIPFDGWLIICADNHALHLKEHAYGNVATYGFDQGADWRGELLTQDDAPFLRVYKHGQVFMDCVPALYGRHNIQNTLAAIAVASTLGAPPEKIAEAVHSFQGVKRRLEVFLEHEGVVYVDDFAHHPTAIRETIAAARMRWPGRRMRVLFEPRSNTTVTDEFANPMLNAFKEADEVWLGPIYRAERISEQKRLDRDELVKGLRSSGCDAHYTDDVKEIVKQVYSHNLPGDIVLILSNGAFGGIYKHFREATGGNTL